MPKYYLSTGPLRVVLDRPNATTAANDFIREHAARCPEIGLLTAASETGFESENPGDLYFSTRTLLEQNGLAHLFRTDPEFADPNELDPQ